MSHTFKHGDPEPPRGTGEWLAWRDAQIGVLYATRLTHAVATQLFRDVERKRFVAVVDGHLAEGEIFNESMSGNRRSRVTYAVVEARSEAA